MRRTTWFAFSRLSATRQPKAKVRSEADRNESGGRQPRRFSGTKNHRNLSRLRWFLAERKGFEPLLEDYSKHDFQSCALDQLSHLSVQVAIRRRVGRTPATCVFYHTSQDLSRGFPKNAEKKLSGAERGRIQASVPPSCPCGFVPVCAFSVRERVDSAGCVPPWQEPAMAQ